MPLFITCYCTSYIEVWLPILAGFVLMTIIPYIHIGILYSKYWVPQKANTTTPSGCGCTCFDTIFRGSFEDQPVGYKHVYWNSTKITFAIYAIYVINIILWYKAVEHLILLGLQRRPIRWIFIILLAINIYPNYFSWWCYFIYLNEGMWEMLWHHLFFYLSELLVACMCLHLAAAEVPLDTWKPVLIFCVSLVHLVQGGLDQFYQDLFIYRGNTQWTTLARDIALVIPDLIHLVVPLIALKMEYDPLKGSFSKATLVKLIVFTLASIVLLRII